MITFSPSYIALTPKKTSDVVKISGELIQALSYSDIKLVVLNSQKETLRERECDTVLKANLISLESTSKIATIKVSIDPETSTKLKGCISTKGEYLALSVTVPKNKTTASSIQNNQRLLIPVFDGTNGNILTTKRTGEVLGAIKEQLRVSEITCQKSVYFKPEDLQCQSTITNATDSGILANILTTMREGLPPGLTKYENLERTNILLLPGQTYTLNFIIPSTSFNLLKNQISVITTFSALGTEGATYTANEEFNIWYMPVVLIVVVCGFLVTLSAILLRNRYIKLTARKNGFKKAKS